MAVSSVKDLVRKTDKTSSISRKVNSGRKRTVRTTPNIERLAELICSQEGNPGSSKSPKEIQKLTGISHISVRQIGKRDLQLKVFRRKKAHLLSDSGREKRVKCCKTLLARRCLQTVDKVLFSDEKIFTVQPPINTQNDRLYAAATKKFAIPSDRLIKGHKHFSKSVMVSVAVSKTGKTKVLFIDKGTKVDGRYYCETLLQNWLLPDICQLCGGKFIFQQDIASLHRAKLTIEFLQQNVPNFIDPSVWLSNSPDIRGSSQKLSLIHI